MYHHNLDFSTIDILFHIIINILTLLYEHIEKSKLNDILVYPRYDCINIFNLKIMIVKYIFSLVASVNR